MNTIRLTIYLVYTLFIILSEKTGHSTPILASNQTVLKSIAEWKSLEFGFPTKADREFALTNKLYVPGNAVIIDVDVQYTEMDKSRLFVTTPRVFDGIPMTLGVVTDLIGDNGYSIHAYPNYNWHRTHGKDCNGLTSVFRVAIDKCNRIWVLDTGLIGDKQICPPQIVVFNSLNDTFIHRYKIPDMFIESGKSQLVTLVVDVKDDVCSDAMVYIADVQAFALLVYSFKTNRCWRIKNKLFEANDKYATITIGDESVTIPDGVFGLAVAPSIGHRHQERTLLFHSLADITENAVPIDMINNETICRHSSDFIKSSFKILGQRPSQSGPQAMDENGNLFFGLMEPMAIACWHSRFPYNHETIHTVAQNYETLQFVSGLKIKKNWTGKEVLWIVSSRYQKKARGTMDLNQINYRIQAAYIQDLIGGKLCSVVTRLKRKLLPIRESLFKYNWNK